MSELQGKRFQRSVVSVSPVPDPHGLKLCFAALRLFCVGSRSEVPGCAL